MSHITATPAQVERLGAPTRLGEGNVAPHWLDPLHQSDVEAVAPLIVQNRAVGILAVGKRWDEELFHDRDLEIIRLIAQQAALFVVTSQQIEELRQVPHRVAEAQERERFKIAQELHDTIQQFLGRLPFHLEVSRALLRTQPDAADARLLRCVDDVEDAAKTLRQIRSDLAPIQLEKGLVQPLSDSVARFRARSGLDVSLSMHADVDAHLTVAARHVLYRVVQQALDNVEAHAHARHASVTIQHTGDHIVFEVSDDGQGFTAEQQAQSESEGHFGLRSMQARVSGAGGALAVTSAPGAGTRVSGWLPAKDLTDVRLLKEV